MSCFDLVIAGGGPVGLVTAIAARLAGLSALVLERATELPEKACGEGLMPAAVRTLEELGVQLDGGRAFRGVRFIDAGVTASASFGEAPGYAINRRGLMLALRTRADRLGVEVRSGHTVREFHYQHGAVTVSARVRGGQELSFRGRLLVAADGLRSPIRRRLGLELTRSGAPRFGLQRHFQCAPWSDWVEVHWHDRAEAYVTPLGDQELGVALLMHGNELDYAGALKLFPELAARLGEGHSDRVRGAGPLEQRAQSVLAPGVALVGDAAGYLDALTGEGLAIGFGSAVALVQRFGRGELWKYPDDHAALTAAYLGMTRLMLACSRAPALRRWSVRFLSARPRLFSRLLRVVSDPPPAHLDAPLHFRAALGRVLA